MTESTTNPPRSFWIISGVALVWNLMGVMAYLMQAYMTDEAIAALPAAERALYENVPSWAVGAFAIAVFGGALGCILLLLRRRIAMPVLVGSLLGILVQMYHSFFIANSIEVYGPGKTIMPIMVIVIGAGLVWYVNSASQKGWLR
jgi:hypothetical protein